MATVDPLIIQKLSTDLDVLQGQLESVANNLSNQLLAKMADFVIPLHAGKEKSVAATKTYIASISALIQLVAYYSQDKSLLSISYKQFYRYK